MKYYPTIGLEIHAELLTESKVFCSCSAEFGGEPNSRSCPVCSGLPGTLPVLNKRAVEFIIKAGRVMDCEISAFTKWDRKNYFYPDLPKAYQISQMPRPVCLSGKVSVKTSAGEKIIRINRIHLEEDAGKLIHDDLSGQTLADYNRCGIPLIEIVTEPDFNTIEEVLAFVEKIRLMLQYAGVCDGKMEQGSLRCDVNVSIAPPNAEKLGTRAEIKNLNSIRSIGRAIEYEIYRQGEILDSGENVIQETRRFNDGTGETLSMRTKEDAHDYRYFPDPDIPPIILTREEIKRIFEEIPEMPEERQKRYMVMGISQRDAGIIISDKVISDFFENSLKYYNNPKALSSFILVELMRRINTGDADMANLPFGAGEFAALVELGYTDKIDRTYMKDVLREMLLSGKNPLEICEAQNLIIKEDLSAVEKVIDEILANNPKVVQQYKNGEGKVFGFLMGQANKALKGVAAAPAIKSCLEKKLNS